ncbi:MAG: hypothetical protein MUF77_07210, partial [Leptospira sp.]|nr:hypothetical protein [Leptospira sp.]
MKLFATIILIFFALSTISAEPKVNRNTKVKSAKKKTYSKVLVSEKTKTRNQKEKIQNPLID